jgi:hypothetical protein
MKDLLSSTTSTHNSLENLYTPDLIANIDETGINLTWTTGSRIVTIDNDDKGEVIIPNKIGTVTYLLIIFANGTSLLPTVLWPSKHLFPEVKMV